MAFHTKKIVPWSVNWDSSRWQAALKSSWPIAVSIAFNLVYFKADTIILSIYANPATVGLYTAPYKILEVLIAFPPLLLGMVLPRWTQAVEQKDMEQFRHWFSWAFDTMAIFILPMIAGTIAVATPLMKFVAGKAFGASGPILQVLITAVGVIFFSQVFGYAVVALKKQKKMIPAYALAAMLSIISYFLTIPRFGPLGAAWSTVGIELVIFFSSVSVVLATTRIDIKVKNLTKYIISSVIMFFVIQLIHNVIPILLVISIGIVIYFLCLIAFNALTLRQIREIAGFSNYRAMG